MRPCRPGRVAGCTDHPCPPPGRPTRLPSHLPGRGRAAWVATRGGPREVLRLRSQTHFAQDDGRRGSQRAEAGGAGVWTIRIPARAIAGLDLIDDDPAPRLAALLTKAGIEDCSVVYSGLQVG